MALHQIQVRHDPVEDRLLLRVSTTDGEEFRFWMTRRFVGGLWGLLVKMLESDEAVRRQLDQETRRTVLDIQHEGYAQQGDFTRAFESAPRSLPLGETPVLLAQAQGRKSAEGQHLISLHPQQGQGVDLTLDTKLLHIFVRLLQQSVAKAEWGLDLRLYKDGEQPPSAVAAQRKLN